MKRMKLLSVFLFITMLCTSCLSYRLGSSLPADIKTVYVPICVNDTQEINIENDVTQALLTEIQNDGSLKIVSEQKNADTTLEVTITKCDLDPVKYGADSEETEGYYSPETTVGQYRMIIQATFTFTRNSTGEVIMTSVASGDYKFTPTGDIVQAKLQALPEASENLAYYILQQVVDYWQF